LEHIRPAGAVSRPLPAISWIASKRPIPVCRSIFSPWIRLGAPALWQRSLHGDRGGASEDFEAAANRINASGTDAVWIQHEYGIFGGEDGNYICNLVDRVAAPVILTLHTVLRDPTPGQRSVLQHLIDRASAVIVMSHEARDLLASLYDARNVTVIPHGVPDRPFGREPAAKACLDLADRRVLMTFGLLGSGKGSSR
jgi:glycosyltransferase involved in cell wall biosynthesis